LPGPTCQSQVPGPGVARATAARPLPPPHGGTADRPPHPLHARRMQRSPRASPRHAVGPWEKPSLLFLRQPLNAAHYALLSLCSSAPSSPHSSAPSAEALTTPHRSRVPLRHAKLEWCDLVIVSVEEAEVLVEDGVPGGELCGPGERDRLILLLPREAVEHGADQEVDACDLDGERMEELRPRLGAAYVASAAASAEGSDGSASAGATDSSEDTAFGTGMPSNSSSSERSNAGVGFGSAGVEGLGFGVVVVTGGEV
jgi:hypothetical protein